MGKVLFLILFLFATKAQAHFFFEPGIGFESGNVRKEYVSSNFPTKVDDHNRAGLTYSIGGGYRYNRWFISSDFEKGLGGDLTDISVSGGVNIAIRVRIYGGYIVSAKDRDSKGSGYKMGIGATLLKLINLNFEYAARDYNKYTGNIAYTGLTYGGNANTYKVTISFPSPRNPF